MISEAKIAKVMKSLGLNRYEAIEMLQDDEAIEKGEKLFELDEEQKKAVKKATSTGTHKRTPTSRERKIDEEKKFLISFFECCIRENLYDAPLEEINTKTETEVNFKYRDNYYTLRLIKHRPPKS